MIFNVFRVLEKAIRLVTPDHLRNSDDLLAVVQAYASTFNVGLMQEVGTQLAKVDPFAAPRGPCSPPDQTPINQQPHSRAQTTTIGQQPHSGSLSRQNCLPGYRPLTDPVAAAAGPPLAGADHERPAKRSVSAPRSPSATAEDALAISQLKTVMAAFIKERLKKHLKRGVIDAQQFTTICRDNTRQVGSGRWRWREGDGIMIDAHHGLIFAFLGIVRGGSTVGAYACILYKGGHPEGVCGED